MGAALEGQVQKLLLIVCRPTIGLCGQLFSYKAEVLEGMGKGWRTDLKAGDLLRNMDVTYGRYFTKRKQPGHDG